MDKKVIKIIGISATIIGFVASMATDWVNDKRIDDKIEEKIKNLDV